MQRTGAKATFFGSITNPVTRFVNALIYAAVGVCGALAATGNVPLIGVITVGQLASFLTYANQYTKPFNEISGVVAELQNAVASAKRVFAVIDEPAESDDSHLPELEHCDGTMQLSHVKFSYVPDRKLITDFNLDVHCGQRIAIVGPTGCGKTYLVKTLARLLDVPLAITDATSLTEAGYIGDDIESVVSKLLAAADNDVERAEHGIIFIDEIDAVARRRGTGLGGGHDEREQTLNQLLVEMDGFGVNEGIIVMAATNRVDILDPAILRPGRFDRKVAVGRPDVKGREEILRVHAKDKPLGEDVNLAQIARTTAGFTGADLENLLNEAAIEAARKGRGFILQSDIKGAFIKVGIGAEKKSKVISEKEKKITAYHESGHAILFHVLPDMDPVYTISIIPTGMGAAGYTMPLPDNDEMFNTKGKMLQDIMTLLGGRIAEEIIFGDITTGASNDIKTCNCDS